MLMNRHRVVVTGLGVLAANGIGKEAFWDSLVAGESGIDYITHFDAHELPWRIGGEIKGFQPDKFMSSDYKPLRQSRTTQLAVAAAKMAVEDAGLEEQILSAVAPVFILLGISLGGLDLVEKHTRRIVSRGLKKGLPSVSACVHISAASIIAAELNVPARIETLSDSCVGGLESVVLAAEEIREGKYDVALAGGADASIISSVVTGLGFSGMLSDDAGDPKAASRPFDRKRTGGILAEGAAVVVLARLEHALARGARLYMEVMGGGCATDVGGKSGSGLQVSMQNALVNSGLTAEETGCVNAHGSSDIVLDRAETEIIKNVIGSQAYKIPVSSIKGVTGNPLAAGGALQVVSSALTLCREMVPPTANHQEGDEFCDLDYVPGRARILCVDNIMINSHGTGAVNASLIVKKI